MSEKKSLREEVQEMTGLSLAKTYGLIHLVTTVRMNELFEAGLLSENPEDIHPCEGCAVLGSNMALSADDCYLCEECAEACDDAPAEPEAEMAGGAA